MKTVYLVKDTFYEMNVKAVVLAQLFYDGAPYHIETSILIYKANQRTRFSGTSVMKELKTFEKSNETS